MSPFVHPILFATFPLLSLFAHNQSEIETGVLWGPLAVCIAVAAALSGVFLLAFRAGPKAGALASLVVFAFFYFGIFSPHVAAWGLTRWWFFGVWAAVCVAAIVALVRTKRDLANLTLIVTAGAAVLILSPVVRIALYQARHPVIQASDPRLWPTRLREPVLPQGATRPDVYFIIPDDYARRDVLKRYFGYADDGFIGQLRKRGFAISPAVRSPYSDSEMNIAATLNMDYLTGLANILGQKSQDVRPVRRLIADNRAARLLRAVGYRYVHLDTDEVTYPAGNPNISPLATPDSFPNLWLRNSLLRLFGGPLGFNDTAADARFRKSIHSMLARLAAMPRDPGPKFVVFHTLLPHDPYIFGAHGQPVTFPDRSDQALGSKLGMAYYLQQLQYVNQALLDVVDAILARSKTPPIIIIQSDEGFQADPKTFGEAAMRAVRVKGLEALYLPGHGKAGVPQPATTVNTLRFVFNHYFGTHYKLLRSASYPEGDFPYQFEEMRVK